MGLDNPEVVDLVVQNPTGKILLLITDAGLGSCDEERLEQFKAKLISYASYIGSEQFVKDYPKHSPKTAVIRSICRIAPTDQMRAIQNVVVAGTSIPVEFEIMN